MKKDRPVVCLSPESASIEEGTLEYKWHGRSRRRKRRTIA